MLGNGTQTAGNGTHCACDYPIGRHFINMLSKQKPNNFFMIFLLKYLSYLDMMPLPKLEISLNVNKSLTLIFTEHKF